MALTPEQKWAIGADLNVLRMVGFSHVRLITFTKGGDPAYATWPARNFLSFPIPSPTELANLREFLAMTAAFGMTSEVVLMMQDSTGMFYQNGVTSADYRAFVSAVFPALWGGRLSRVYLGGDLHLGAHDGNQAMVASHRDWLMNLWPHLVSLCPGCAFGIELASSYATLWDMAADSIAWVRANMTARPPNFIGCQLYPSSRASVRAWGFEHGGVIDWAGLTNDWIGHLRAAAGPIPVTADEIGMEVGGEWTEQDQATFLRAAYGALNVAGVPANIWDYGAHLSHQRWHISETAAGDFGLFTVDRQPRPAVAMIAGALAAARARNLAPGIQYDPVGYDDLAWLTP